jgi:vitamin B12 transporter
MPFFDNPQLKPERAVSGELGLDWQAAENLSFSLTGFYSRYRNMIAFVPEQNLLNHVNAENVRLQGLEVEARYRPQKDLNIGVDYTYTDSRNAASARQLIDVPVHRARLFGAWQASAVPVSLYLEGIFASGWDWQNAPATRVGVGDSLRMNAQLGYHLTKTAMLYVRGENLNDDRTPLYPTYGTIGVALYGGVRLSLN